MVDWKKYLPIIVIVGIGVATVVFIAWLWSLQTPSPPGY